MKVLMLVVVLCLSTFGTAGNYWSDDQINQALNLVGQGQALQATELVRSWNASPHDFGIDLLSRGRGLEAMYWLQAISSPEIPDWELNRAGHAWVLFLVGQRAAAKAEAQALSSSQDPMVQARAAYLMAVVHAVEGDLGGARDYAQQSRNLFATLDSESSLRIVDNLLEWMSSFKADGMPPLPPPIGWFGDGD